MLSCICELNSLEDQIAVLAHLFVQLGIAKMSDVPQGTYDIDKAAQLALQDIDKNGETTANALLRQGLILLTWIQEK